MQAVVTEVPIFIKNEINHLQQISNIVNDVILQSEDNNLIIKRDE